MKQKFYEEPALEIVRIDFNDKLLVSDDAETPMIDLEEEGDI